MEATAATEKGSQAQISSECNNSVENETEVNSQPSRDKKKEDLPNGALPGLQNVADPTASEPNLSKLLDPSGEQDKPKPHLRKGRVSVLPLKKVKSGSGKSSRQCRAREGHENSSAVMNVAGDGVKSASKLKKKMKKLKPSEKKKIKWSFTTKKGSGNKGTVAKDKTKHLYKA